MPGHNNYVPPNLYFPQTLLLQMRLDCVDVFGLGWEEAEMEKRGELGKGRAFSPSFPPPRHHNYLYLLKCIQTVHGHTSKCS